MKLETKRHAAWSWTGRPRLRTRASAEVREATEEAGDDSLSFSELEEGEKELDEADEADEGEDEDCRTGNLTAGFFTTGLFAAGLLAVLRALRSVACVSLRRTMSNSSLYPGHCRLDLAHWLQVGLVSSH